MRARSFAFRTVAAFSLAAFFLPQTASAAWWCPEAILHAIGYRSVSSPAKPEVNPEEPEPILRWSPTFLECKSTDGSLVRTPIAGEPTRRYGFAGHHGRPSSTDFFDQQRESGAQWLPNGVAIEGCSEKFSAPTEKNVLRSFRFQGSSISNWCEEVELVIPVRLSAAAGNTLHKTSVSCHDLGCFGLGKR